MKKNNSSDNTPQEERYEHYRFVAAKKQEPLRVDKFLMNFIENAIRNKIQQAAREGNIYVNGKAVKPNYKVKAGDEVTVMLPHPPHQMLLQPEAIALEVVYEDDQLLVVNKPAGMVVHPGHGNYKGTLVNALLHHFHDLPQQAGNRPGLVHRIDKDTSGLLVIAKTEQALHNLAKQFFNKTTQRTYFALVWGNLEADAGAVRGHIGRHLKNRLQMDVFSDESYGKEAVTRYQVQERFGYVTLLSCTLETGRTHQIRVHMKHIGHPLFNDARYGGDKILKGVRYAKYKQFVENCFRALPRQALHAQTLGFAHPVTGQWLQFSAPLPADMEQCLEKWRQYAKHRLSENA